MFCAVENGDLELVRYHLRMGIDPNFQHPEVLSLPLVESARQGHVEIVKLLLEFGAEPTSFKAGWEGVNALEMAELCEQEEVIEVLRAHLGLPIKRRNRWQRWLGKFIGRRR